MSNTHAGWSALLRWGFAKASHHLVLTREGTLGEVMDLRADVKQVMTAWDASLLGGRVAEVVDGSPWLYLGVSMPKRGCGAVAMLDHSPERRLVVAGEGPEADRLRRRLHRVGMAVA